MVNCVEILVTSGVQELKIPIILNHMRNKTTEPDFFNWVSGFIAHMIQNNWF